jgi:hypothetical protein
MLSEIDKASEFGMRNSECGIEERNNNSEIRNPKSETGTAA